MFKHVVCLQFAHLHPNVPHALDITSIENPMFGISGGDELQHEDRRFSQRLDISRGCPDYWLSGPVRKTLDKLLNSVGVQTTDLVVQTNNEQTL